MVLHQSKFLVNTQELREGPQKFLIDRLNLYERQSATLRFDFHNVTEEVGDRHDRMNAKVLQHCATTFHFQSSRHQT